MLSACCPLLIGAAAACLIMIWASTFHACPASVSVVAAPALQPISRQGNVTKHGFTKVALDKLKVARGFLAEGAPRTLGGCGSVTEAWERMISQRLQAHESCCCAIALACIAQQVLSGKAWRWQDLIKSCLVRMQAFTSLAVKALAAELPGHDLLNAFCLFDCHGRSARFRGDEAARLETNIRSAERLAQVFNLEVDGLYNEHLDHEGIALHGHRSRNLSNFEAWKSAVLRTRARRSTKENHPSDNLLRVLIRYGAFSGATTSGVEQSFSRLEKHFPANKRKISWEHELDEAKLVLDHDSSQEELICKAAKLIWLQYFPPPRSIPAGARFDKGCKRKQRHDQARRGAPSCIVITALSAIMYEVASLPKSSEQLAARRGAPPRRRTSRRPRQRSSGVAWRRSQRAPASRRQLKWRPAQLRRQLTSTLPRCSGKHPSSKASSTSTRCSPTLTGFCWDRRWTPTWLTWQRLLRRSSRLPTGHAWQKKPAQRRF